MKKFLTMVLAVIMLCTAAAVAEQAEAASPTGTWYVNQLVMDGNAYANVSAMGFEMVLELNEDGTGLVYTSEDNKGSCAWKANDDGTLSFIEAATQQEMPMTLTDETLVLGAGNNYYIFTRTKEQKINFAEVVSTTSAADFDGKYALTHVSGEGYTMPVENALADLNAMGIENTGITIKDGAVEMFGQEAKTFSYETDGTLVLDTEDGLELTNMKMFKLDNGGIALNWLGLTFHAGVAE